MADAVRTAAAWAANYLAQATAKGLYTANIGLSMQAAQAIGSVVGYTAFAVVAVGVPMAFSAAEPPLIPAPDGEVVSIAVGAHP